MATDWYCKISGEKYGPLSAKQLKGMATKGELSAEDWVKQGEDGSWVAAAQIKGLFGAALTTESSTGGKSKPLPVARAAPLPPASPDAAPPQEAPSKVAPSPQVAKAAPVSPSGTPQVGVPQAAVPQAAVPQAAAAQDAFGISTATEQRPAAVPTAPSSPKYANAVARKKKQAKLVLSLVGLLVGIAVVGIVLVVFTGGDPEEQIVQTEPRIPSQKETIEDFSVIASSEEDSSTESGSSTGDSVSRTPAESGPGPEETEDTPDGTFVDASRETYHLAPLAVRVDSAKILKPKMRKVDEEGKVVIVPSGKECLLITLEITNTQAAGAVRYASFASQRTRMSLVDDMDESYANIGIPANRTVEGQTRKAEIPPGKTITDVVIFKKPAGDIDHLKMMLPGSVYRAKGTLGFLIPADMIETIPEGDGQTDPAPDLPGMGKDDPFAEVEE